mgnify:CR=1 FL=1
MFGLGAGEIAVILVIALIFIGPKKLPELARSLGKGLREFQKAKDEMMSEIHKSGDEDDEDEKKKESKEDEQEDEAPKQIPHQENDQSFSDDSTTTSSSEEKTEESQKS